jgi:hypothetical protein
LRGAYGESVVASRVPALIGEADITDAGTNVSELPWPPAIFVISAGRKLPSDRSGVFDAAFSLTVAL